MSAAVLSAAELLGQGAKEVKDPTTEQIQQAFQQLELQINSDMQKIGELEMEVRKWYTTEGRRFMCFTPVKVILTWKNQHQQKKEHELALEALNKVPEDRRCCRMVGGVLAQRIQ